MKKQILILAALLCFAASSVHADTISLDTRGVQAATGHCALDYTFNITKPTVLYRAELHFDAAQTADADIVMQLDSKRGPELDVRLYRGNPDEASEDGGDTGGIDTANLVLWPAPLPIDAPLYLEPGDALRFTYANPDGATFGLRLVLSTGASSTTVVLPETGCPEPEEGEGVVEGEGEGEGAPEGE